MICIRLLRLAENQCFNLYKTQSARYTSQFPMRFLETQNMWRDKDNVSKRWELIYKAPMGLTLKFASAYLTLTTGVISIGSLYYAAFVFDVADLNTPIIIGDNVVIANNPTEGLIYLGAFVALHIATQLLLFKYVVRLYQSGDEYLAIYRGFLFNSIKKHKFHLNEFKKLNSSTMIFPWSDSKYKLGKKKGILLQQYFKTPECLNYLLYKKSKNNLEE